MEEGGQGAEQGGPRPPGPSPSLDQGTAVLPEVVQFSLEGSSVIIGFPDSQAGDARAPMVPSYDTAGTAPGTALRELVPLLG